jgi:hypothetical protein
MRRGYAPRAGAHGARRTVRVRKIADRVQFAPQSRVVCLVLSAWRGRKKKKHKGAPMQLSVVFEVLLLVAIVAGALIGWGPRPPLE